MSTVEIAILVTSHLGAFVAGALVFRNNSKEGDKLIANANNLIATGKAVIDATGKIIKKA